MPSRPADDSAAALRPATAGPVQDAADGDTVSPGPERLVAALDSLVRRTMDEGRIPGLALVVLQGGEVADTRGYGVADRSAGRPVDPEATRFALGSMSKLVTAVAALQLRASGRLDLHAPASRRLPRGALPDGPGGPVTLHHLLTHTSGLESASIGVAARSASELEGLHAYFSSSEALRRTRPPGELYVYSQHGYGLVGLAVAGASGRTYVQYAHDEVLRPAGMEASSFRPGALDHPATAPGYVAAEDGFREAPRAYHRIPPAGGLVAPPREMGALMEAVLRDASGAVPAGDPGRSGQLLPPGAAGDLLRRQWSPHPHPAVEGTAYGLFEYRSCGIRALTSRGWVGGHSSYLHLVPGRDAGFLVAANASSLQGLESTLRQELHRRLAGGDCPGRTERDGGAADLSAGVPGRYRSVGFASTGVESLGRTFLADEVVVRRTGSGAARVVLGGSPVEARAVDSLLLAAPWGEGQEELFAFLPDASGGTGYMMWGGAAYEKVSPLGRRATAWGLAALALTIFVVGLLVPAGRVARARLSGASAGADVPSTGARAQPSGPHEPDAPVREGSDASWDGLRPGPDRALRWGAAALSAVWLAFTAGLVGHLVGTARYTFAFGVPDTVRPFLWLPAAGTVLALVMAPGLRRVWKERAWPAWERVEWSAVVVTALAAGVWALSAGLMPW